MKRGLTKAQKERFDFVKVFIEQNGYAPTLQEIAQKFNTSTAAVHYMISELEKKGWIARTKYAERDITITT